MQNLKEPQKFPKRRWKIPWKDQWKKWFRRDNLIVLVLSGILLFVIALPTKDKSDPDAGAFGGSTKRTEVFWQEGGNGANDTDAADGAAGTSAVNGATGGGQNLESYATEQEKRLEEILSVMEGVGRVEVMLTFSATEELVVEKERPTVRSDTKETDSAGGSRIAATLDKGDSAVYRTVGGDREPYVVKTILPRVEGVLVVAEGAEKASVRKAVTQSATALFGVEAHKVVVVPMKSGDR